MFWTRYVKRVPFVNRGTAFLSKGIKRVGPLRGASLYDTLLSTHPHRGFEWVFSDPKIWKKYWIKNYDTYSALSLWLQVGGQQKSYPLGESLGCLLSLPRASAILYGTQASFAWPRARWSGQIWQICNGHFFWFHGICWIRFASLGEASWSEYLRQFCFHDLGVVMYRCGFNFVKNVVLESESMWYGG